MPKLTVLRHYWKKAPQLIVALVVHHRVTKCRIGIVAGEEDAVALVAMKAEIHSLGRNNNFIFV